MIFLTVGTQLPFERLVKSVDAWAQQHPDVEIFAQTGDTKYQPKHMRFVQKMTPQQYSVRFTQAQMVISHVGMGTIISGLEIAKPLILMPRLASMGEHRNDHQLGTAKKFAHFDLIDIVNSEQELYTAMATRLQYSGAPHGAAGIGTSPELIARLKSFVNGAD